MVHISSDLIGQMVEEAARALPEECCGLLLGEGGCITEIRAAKNVHYTPQTHFAIDPAALFKAQREGREGGAELIGYYHSHPNGRASPSQADAQMAAHDGKIWAIIASQEVSFWKDGEEGFYKIARKARA